MPLLGPTSVPFEAAELAAEPDAGELADELDVDGLLDDAEPDAVTLGLAVSVAVEVAVTPQGAPVASAAVWPVALLLAAAEAGVVTLFVGLLVAVEVAVAVAVAVPVALSLSPGLAVSVAAGLLLVPPLAGLVAADAGVTLGVTDLLVALAAGDDVGLGGHAVDPALLGLMAVLLWLRPPADEPAGLPVPARLGVPPVLCEVIPVDWPSWTRAWRVGGSSRATPTANRAQAIARVGRSSPSRQSLGG